MTTVERELLRWVYGGRTRVLIAAAIIAWIRRAR